MNARKVLRSVGRRIPGSRCRRPLAATLTPAEVSSNTPGQHASEPFQDTLPDNNTVSRPFLHSEGRKNIAVALSAVGAGVATFVWKLALNDTYPTGLGGDEVTESEEVIGTAIDL